nr:hypothetical protein [Chloroflexia bacterium]
AQFIARTGEFDVFVALVVDHRPVVAVAGHPASGRLIGAIDGAGAWWLELDGRRLPAHVTPQRGDRPPRLVASKWYRGVERASELEAIATALGAETPPVLDTGFTPRKLLTEPRPYDGFLGVAPHWRQTPAREWDLATPDLIVNEAGGRFTDLRGRPHRYNKPSARVSGGLLISADPDLHKRLLAALRAEGLGVRG